MNNKTHHEKDKEQKRSPVWDLFSPFLSPEDSAAMMLYYGGCMGAIIFVTLLIRWLVGMFK